MNNARQNNSRSGNSRQNILMITGIIAFAAAAFFMVGFLFRSATPLYFAGLALVMLAVVGIAIAVAASSRRAKKKKAKAGH